MKNCRSRFGYTIIELITVLCIVALLAAIAVPTMIGFIETGRQNDRMETARTLYMIAQNRLSELRTSKNLKAEITAEFYDLDNGNYTEKHRDFLLIGTNVFTKLGADNFPRGEIDSDNQPYIHYISKPAGKPDATNPIVKLLGTAIFNSGMDDSILNGAILIEFNIKTGGVLSVFYSDVLEQSNNEFQYTGGDAKNNIFGIRGDKYYGIADKRKQGYYGVTETGVEIVHETMSVTLRDSSVSPGLFYGGGNSKNALYAEIVISEEYLDKMFDLSINEKVVHSGKLFSGLSGADSQLLSDAISEHALVFVQEPLIYRHDGEIIDGFARIFWVLDYIGENAEFNINAAYGEFDQWENFTVTVELQQNSDDVLCLKSNVVHPYFQTMFNTDAYQVNGFAVSSARHLNNIRYFQDENNEADSDDSEEESDEPEKVVFTQINDIDLDGITLEPLPNFIGIYDGGGRTIKNLRIDLPDDAQIGLFVEIAEDSIVTALTLENADVLAASEIGGIAGINWGTIEKSAVINSVIRQPDGRTDNHVGGIAGSNYGIITNVYFLSTNPHDDPPISPNGGGIVGYNHQVAEPIAPNEEEPEHNGTVSHAFYFAPAPTDGTLIYPIVRTGNPADKVTIEGAEKETCFYLNGEKYFLFMPGEDFDYDGFDFADVEWVKQKYQPYESNGGGGLGLTPESINIERLNVYCNFDTSEETWYQPGDPDNPDGIYYPYPMQYNLPIPKWWVITG